MATTADPSIDVPLTQFENAYKSSNSRAVPLDAAKTHATSIDVPAKIVNTNSDVLDEEDFSRWRPTYHLMPRQNWANDPCGPCYIDSDGGYYHIAFQWNPYNWNWGNMSWCHALSRDLVHWEVSPQPSIQPSVEDDPCGVFTGCALPMNPRGVSDTTLTGFYTSAQHTPIHWTLPYRERSELIRMATSEDYGRTWKRSPISSLVSGPPNGVEVTGWRDPFIGQWESVDKCLARRTGDYMYGVIAGGIRRYSPTIFLYSIDAHDLTQWSYLCMPFAPGTNFAPSPRLPDFGSNWEVTNFMTLRDNLGHDNDILVMSVEGGLSKSEQFSTASGVYDQLTKARRSNRTQNWLCARVKKNTSEAFSNDQPSVVLDFRFGGCLDFGCFYAANSFHDPKTDTRIVYGWITEEDLPASLVERQKWSGLLSLPRVLGMRCIQRVVAASRSNLLTLDWIHCIPSQDGTFIVTALTSSPDPRMTTLRRNEKRLAHLPVSLDSHFDGGNPTTGPLFLPFHTKNLEVMTSLTLTGDVEQIGLILYLCPRRLSKVTIFFDPREEVVVIERNEVHTGYLAGCVDINKDSEMAPHTLFSTQDSLNQLIQSEALNIRIFFDVSVLEVFVNERVAITTRIYPESGRCFGVQPFARYAQKSLSSERATILECACWELQPSVTWIK